MFESIDLKIADEGETSSIIRSTVTLSCTKTGCWSTSCKFPC